MKRKTFVMQYLPSKPKYKSQSKSVENHFLSLLQELYTLAVYNRNWSIDKWDTRKIDVEQLEQVHNELLKYRPSDFTPLTLYVERIKRKVGVVDSIVARHSSMEETLKTLEDEIGNLDKEHHLKEVGYNEAERRVDWAYFKEDEKYEQESFRLDASSKKMEMESAGEDLLKKMKAKNKKDDEVYQIWKRYLTSVEDLRKTIMKYAHMVSVDIFEVDLPEIGTIETFSVDDLPEDLEVPEEKRGFLNRMKSLFKK